MLALLAALVSAPLAAVPWPAAAAFDVALVSTFAALVLFVPALVQLSRRGALPAADFALFALLVVVAYALRALLPDATLIHENRHGYHLLPRGLGIGDTLRGLEVSLSHGVFSSHGFLTSLTALVVSPADAHFARGLLLSSLSVGGVYALALQWTASRAAAFAAGTLLATLPLSLLFAPTEEFLVTACGLVCIGAALVHAGVARRSRLAVIFGVLLVGLGASAREVTLPLALLAPISAFAASRRGEGVREALAIAASLAVLLLPQALNVVTAALALPEAPGYVGFPILPWERAWAGWSAPQVPTWLGVAMLAGTLLCPLWLHARGRPRAALALLAALVVAQLAGGFVRVGNWPSQLRHQLFALSLFTIPAGWLLATALRRAAVVAVVVPLLGAAPLVLSPEAYRPRCTHVEEYRFVREALAALPESAALAWAERAPGEQRLPLLPWDFVRRSRPDLRKDDSVAPHEPDAYFMIDRACFVGALAFAPNASGARVPEPSSLVPRVATPFGRLGGPCARVALSRPWDVVLARSLAVAPPPHDLPMPEAKVTLYLLRRRPPTP